MQALLVTVTLEKSYNELRPLLESYSRSLVACSGYLDHVWLRDRENIVLFHFFEDDAAVKSYIRSGQLATLAAHPACTGRIVARGFQVLSGAAELETQVPVRPLAFAAAEVVSDNPWYESLNPSVG